MAEIIVGEKVINKSNERGTILSLSSQYFTVDFGVRVASFQLDAFEKGFLAYENTALQSNVDAEKVEKEQAKEAVRLTEEKAREARIQIQAELSKAHFNVAVLSATIRLDPAPITLTSVRKKDQELIQKIFAECDKETEALYGSVKPELEYLKSYQARSKYCVGFLSKHADTYVFRVFSRNDNYSKQTTGAVTVSLSDTTEVLRVLRVNDKTYYFSKNLSAAAGHLVNTKAHGKWHVSDLSNSLMLDEVIKNCDCQYLNDHISQKKIDCLQYLNLLIPAIYNNKAEIVFKHGLFSSAYCIDDIVSYLEPFSPKQIVLACTNNTLHVLPIIKHYGVTDATVLQGMEEVLRKRRHGNSIYNVLEREIARLELDCPDLTKKLIAFLRKLERFNAAVYYDYINEISHQQGTTLRDFFDKDYITRHYTMLMEKQVYYTKQQSEAYAKIAEELSWIEREDNGYFIILPKTISEFRHEGEMQHNCVYTNEYYRLVIDRESIIVFLRKEKDTPFVTIEFEYETFEVLQAHGKFNSSIDRELYEYIVELGKRLHYEMRSQQ